MEKLLSFTFFIIFHKATRKFCPGTELMIRMKLQYIYTYPQKTTIWIVTFARISWHFMNKSYMALNSTTLATASQTSQSIKAQVAPPNSENLAEICRSGPKSEPRKAAAKGNRNGPGNRSITHRIHVWYIYSTYIYHKNQPNVG